MLLVNTRVGSSKIAGMGLFANQNIKRGTIVWQYTPSTCALLTETQVQILEKSFHKTEEQLIRYYLTYCYYESHLGGIVLALDNGRFFNHSSAPLCGWATDVPKQSAWHYSIALRDIAEGEELTEDYTTYDTAEWLNALCNRYGVLCHYPKAQPLATL